MNEYEVYKMYSALKMHFSTSYDYFKYKGNINRSIEKYKSLSQHERRFYKNISEREFPKTFLVGNFLYNPKKFILDFNEEYYLTYKKYLTNGILFFERELKSYKDNISNLFKFDSSGNMNILKLYMEEQLSIFFVSVFQHLLNWVKKIDVNFLNENYIKDVEKKYKFFYIDKSKYKQSIIQLSRKM